LDAAIARLVDHLALLGRERILRDVPRLRRRRDEHRASRRSGAAEDLPHAADAVTAGSELLSAEVRVSVLQVGGRPLVLDLRPVPCRALGPRPSAWPSPPRAPFRAARA